MVYDEDSVFIGHVHTMAEVCDEIVTGVRP
jgi:hypothetical protein